jgi:hypothetical protein
LAADPFWIWGDPHGATGVPPGTNWFRKTLILDGPLQEATVFVQVDNSARMYVNGERARGADSADWSQPGVYDIRKLLRPGTNVIALEAVNGGDGPNPAGVLVYAKLREKTDSGERVLDFASDASWRVSRSPVEGWRGATTAGDWTPAQVLGATDLAPWNVGPALAQAVAGKPVYGQVRASLTSADPLALALGRPNREQVTTVRQTTPTTIQALELTNGETLAKLLRRGAEQLLASQADGRALAERVFSQALSRPPTSQELALAVELVGTQPRREGVEDLLWSVAMLPEFQLTF